MKYGIGLDCGIASTGYSVMALDENDEPYRIIRLGSRIFPQAENPKDGASLALPRRTARGLRRRLRRHKHRNERIRYLLVQKKVVTQEELDSLFEGQLSDIYMLRTRALDEKVSNRDFARILIHISQRRGFKSNRKSDKDAEAGKLLSAIEENTASMQAKGYRTVGEMYCKDERYAQSKRNKGEAYLNTVSRAMIAEEIHLIFAKQRDFGCSFASEEIENEYTTIVMSQRPFDVGPGSGNKNSPSPYAGDQIEKMIGKCTLIPEEKRAAKATYSFQKFTLWQNINNMVIISDNGESRFLTDAERIGLFEYCHKTASVDYKKIRKYLELSDKERFRTLTYGQKEIDEVEKAKFEFLKPYHEMRKAFDRAIKKDYILLLSDDDLDNIGYAVTVYKTDEKISAYLREHGLTEVIINAVIAEMPSFSKFGHISVKACKKIIPFLEEGMTYNDACAAAGIDFRAHGQSEKNMYLPANGYELEDITNPVVRRAVSQTIKVINAIIREQGHSPTYVKIELARELSKTFSERGEIKRSQDDNAARNQRIKEKIQNDFGILNPTGIDIVKLKLWEEQDGRCPYSQKAMQYERLFEDGYVDVDHIIPYSICFDDSYNNKVLTFSSENRQKGNKIPMQYLSGKAKDDFQVWVNSTVKNYKKKQKLLKARLTPEDIEDWKSRNLNDTKYLSRVLFNYINDNLSFEEYNSGRKKHVMAVNGAITAYMRKRWGISKIREDGDLHHAVDATVIACVTDRMVQKVSAYSRYKEIVNIDTDDLSLIVDANGEVVDKFPMPYPTFRKELDIRTSNDPQRLLREVLLPNYTAESIAEVKPCFVSRMPNHKVTGQANLETIRSGREDGFTITKVPLTSLKLKDGEIQNYYNPGSDRLLYNALKARLEMFDGNGEKAFKDYEFHKPKADGSEGPIVKKVKIIEKASLSVPVRQGTGVAANGSMVRIDVFYVDGEGYYFIPIYVSDTTKKRLPSKACVAFKTYEEWKEMDDEDFVFSLYPNDLIEVKSKRGIKLNVEIKGSTLPKELVVNEGMFYYRSAGIAVAQISVINNDNSYGQTSLGIKSLSSIEKYVVDPLGNYSKVGKEKRMSF